MALFRRDLYMADVWDNPATDFYDFMQKGRIIGRGSTRLTYRCDKEIVVKAPKSKHFELGQSQNAIEMEVYQLACDRQRKYLAQVYHWESDFIVCERLRPVTKENRLGNIVEHIKSLGNSALANEIEDFILDLSGEYHLHLMDLFQIGNWGIDKQGNYKLLDYGASYDLCMDIYEQVG
jgi:hypothetical protein